MKKRQSGVLMHISSLPGAYGIGSFGQSAYDFVDFLVRTKQRYWQILPLGATSYRGFSLPIFLSLRRKHSFYRFRYLGGARFVGSK